MHPCLTVCSSSPKERKSARRELPCRAPEAAPQARRELRTDPMKALAGVGLAVACLCSTLAARPAGPTVPERPASSAPEDLARQGAEALNARRLEPFRRLAGSGVDLGWTRNLPPEADAANPWVGGVLSVNGRPWV